MHTRTVNALQLDIIKNTFFSVYKIIPLVGGWKNGYIERDYAYVEGLRSRDYESFSKAKVYNNGYIEFIEDEEVKGWRR